MGEMHDEVAAFLESSATLLRDGGRVEAADQLGSQDSGNLTTVPSLFVAGEDKRGKSCLVNALLRRPDLSPVGVEVVTAAPIIFSRSSEPTGKVFHYGEVEPMAMDFEEARAQATVQGNPLNELGVRAVQLGVDAPILANFNLIDSPGVGGLESGHAALTLQSLRSADALIFVTEAGAQFRAEELSFLRRATARIDTVILVLTKVDLHRGWRTIMDDDRAIIREQAPRFAQSPMVPVSALLALRGLTVDDPEEAEAIRRESGLTELEELIQAEVVDRAAVLREANMLRGASASLAGLAKSIQETLRSLDQTGARDELKAERERLEALRQEKATWPRALDSEMRKLTLERVAETSRGMVEIRHRFAQRLREVKRSEYETLPGELVADLTALEGRLNEEAAERLTTLVRTLLHDLDAEASLEQAVQKVTESRLAEQLGTPLEEHSLTLNDTLLVLLGFTAGRSIASLATVAAGSIIAPPIGLAVGLGLGAVFAFESFVTRDRSRFTAAFQSWMQAQIGQAQLAISNSFQRRMLDVQDELRDAIRKSLAERERDVTRTLHESEQLLQSQASQRQTQETQLRDRLQAIRAQHEGIEQLLARLSPTAQPPQPSGPAESES